jgi:carbamoyl-phosphate synthase small subunit
VSALLGNGGTSRFPQTPSTGPLTRRGRFAAGFLALEDGTVFRGVSVAADGFAVGEAVFTTAMTGYQEIVTDPSFAEQLVCFTAPMIGNYGIAGGCCESSAVHARAIVMREARGPAWTDWLHERGVVALSGIDTRSLVLKLRSGGAMRAVAAAGASSVEQAVEVARKHPRMDGRRLAPRVSTRQPFRYGDGGRARIAVVDYGCKRSILRKLAACGAAVTVYPHDVDSTELVQYDGVVLSNGPGDPQPLVDETAVVRELLGRVPLLGICLGHQLLALATGHETYKLPFGHRGANHPVVERATRRVLVTAQNHGFAVAPSEAHEATHVSLYDGTVEGLSLPAERARSVQFHPEAGPGPHDAWPLIERWIEEVACAEAA